MLATTFFIFGIFTKFEGVGGRNYEIGVRRSSSYLGRGGYTHPRSSSSYLGRGGYTHPPAAAAAVEFKGGGVYPASPQSHLPHFRGGYTPPTGAPGRGTGT